MFIKPKTPSFKAPPGAEVSFEVRYAKGRKPFDTRSAADDFAKEQRASGGWAEISQVTRVVVEGRK